MIDLFQADSVRRLNDSYCVILKLWDLLQSENNIQFQGEFYQVSH